MFIGGAHVALRTVDASIAPASDRLLAFGGRASIEIPAGATVVSDPVGLEVPPLSDVAVSLFLPKATEATTSHHLALQTSYVSTATGDASAAVNFPVASTSTSWPFLTGVDVVASSQSSAIVAFGDSLIDGDGSTEDANQRWTDLLARRLQKEAPRGTTVSVLNEGIIGNRLLNDSPRHARNPAGPLFGPSGLARFERDVLTQAGVRCVIVGIGLNDIGLPSTFAPASERVSAEEMISGYRQLIARARKERIRIVASTLPPFEHATIVAGYYTAKKDALRRTVNDWIRSSGEFDAVIDSDAVLRDPSHPARLLARYDSGDHLHPNDAGQAAIATAILLPSLGLE
ncbi:SGNH/GDSL hydrolase family protein [Myxococcaceae bacterium JPH2]|nr:SGNH/GDSL hydrolase family protein [Myxococcaceae bacterium JPH2]